MSIAITSSPNRAPRVLKRWLIAISSSAVASVTVIRTYWWRFAGLGYLARRLPRLGHSTWQPLPGLSSGSVFFQASKAGRNSGRKRRSKRSASFLSPWASAFSHSTTVEALYEPPDWRIWPLPNAYWHSVSRVVKSEAGLGLRGNQTVVSSRVTLGQLGRCGKSLHWQ